MPDTKQPDNPAKRKIIHSWCMYDWANSAFATTIMAAVPRRPDTTDMWSIKVLDNAARIV